MTSSLSAGRPTRSTWNRAQRLGDRDHLRRPAARARARRSGSSRSERVVVVLRRDEPVCSERSVDVRVHEVRVHDVGVPRLSANAQRQPRIDVTRRGDPGERHGQRLVERVRCARRVVEPEEAHVDSALRERRQQRQKMPFGAADPADAMDVQDLHLRSLRCERPLDRARGEQRDQEVGGDAVASGSYERHGGDGLIREHGKREADESPGGHEDAERAPARREATCTAAGPGCGSHRGRSPSPRRSCADPTPCARPARRASPSRRDGHARTARPCAGSTTGSHTRRRGSSCRSACRCRAPPRGSGTDDPGILDVVDPLPLREQVVGLVVVRLPECAAVRRERKATDLDLVADHPRGNDQHARRHEGDGRPAPTVADHEIGRDEERNEQEPRRCRARRAR